MIKGIKHIIFDLGGVLLNIDYRLTEKAFIDLGIQNFNELFNQFRQNDFFDNWETGKINRQQFIEGIQNVSPVSLSESQIVDAWNAMLLDFPLRRLQILQQLRIYYDLVLLSNINEIHEEAIDKMLRQTNSVNIANFFDKVYYSHRVGMRKPSEAIFMKIMEENDFKPENTLFIDDSPQHAATAKSLGIQTIYLEKGMTIEKDIFKSKN